MKRLLSFAAITIITGCAGWTTEQKVLGGVSVALDAIDYETTKKCLSMANCHESNPLLGEHPSNSKLAVFKIGMAAAKLDIADAFPSMRTGILRVMNVIQLGVDINNAKIVGMKWGF